MGGGRKKNFEKQHSPGEASLLRGIVGRGSLLKTKYVALLVYVSLVKKREL